MNSQKEIENRNNQIGAMEFGPLNELINLFTNKISQIRLLHENVKSVFSPIRACVKNCSSQLEDISELFNNELLAIEDLSERKISKELFYFDEKIGNKQKDLEDFLSLLEQNLDSYQEDIKQTKLALVDITSISSRYKEYNNAEFNIESLHARVEKIHTQISLVDSAILQLKSKISLSRADCSTATSGKSNQSTAKLKEELIVLLGRIHNSSKKQLQLTETSQATLEELSTFLQYEDIIGQKLEHIEQIFQQIIDGLQSWNEIQNIEESPYYKLIPDLSALIISHLALVKDEYYTIMGQISTNASLVKNSLEQFSSSALDTQSAIEHKLQVLNNICSSLQACLKVYDGSNHNERNISPQLEYYFTTILNNTYEVLAGIMDISVGGNLDVLNAAYGAETYRDVVLEAKEMMSRIYLSINKVISEKNQIEDENSESNTKLKLALSNLEKLSREVSEEDNKYKTIIYQKSNLSEKLGSEIGLKLEQISKNHLVDTIIDECSMELEKYAERRNSREIGKTEEGIYKKLHSIYSMDSERKIHEQIVNNHGTRNTETVEVPNEDLGSVELF